MKKKVIRLATRKSALALKQTNWVKTQLQAAAPEIEFRVVPIVTEGDKATDLPLTQLGGKGLFVKALEEALLSNKADIAVHSMKDMTVDIPPGLILAAITRREDPRDAFLSNHYKQLIDLPSGATVGTISRRRHYQLHVARPDLCIKPLRGNINTRLKKLDDGQFDAIILAAAGLIRLGESQRISAYLNCDKFIPAPGQGALGIECRVDDTETHTLIADTLHHTLTAVCVLAERQTVRVLGGNCLVPVAVYGETMEASDGGLCLRVCGEVGRLDGSAVIKSTAEGTLAESVDLGDRVAVGLLAQGAGEIIKDYLASVG